MKHNNHYLVAFTIVLFGLLPGSVNCRQQTLKQKNEISFASTNQIRVSLHHHQQHGQQGIKHIHGHLDSSSSRKLSIWSTIMNFIKCPTGPLGRDCDASSSSSSSDSSTSSASHSSSSSSKNNSSGSSSGKSGFTWYTLDRNDDYFTKDTSNNNVNNNNKSYDQYNNANNDVSEEGNQNSATRSSNSFLTWVFLLLGLVFVSSVIALVAHKSSQTSNMVIGGGGGSHRATHGHALTGAVRKRMTAFKNAYRSKFGDKKRIPDEINQGVLGNSYSENLT